MGTEDIGYVDQEKQQIYAELALSTRGRAEKFFYNLNSQEELLKLIDVFRKTSSDGKRFVEKKIVRILLQNNSLTGYKEEHGAKILCTNITDKKKVEEAATVYRTFAEKLPKASEISDLFFKQLHDIYLGCRSSADFLSEYVTERMKKISPELMCDGDSIRLLILKQFLKASEFPKLGCMSSALRDYIYEKTETSKISSKQEILKGISEITDDVFEKLNEIPESGKDAQKVFRERWEPLFWSNDIANGIFNDQQTTRSKLYWFAIMFDMSYYTGFLKDEFDEKTDIQKNLFYDYYADNLLNNFIHGNLKVEKEPTGHGINYKNFVEVIYLYYIYKKDMSPYKKWTSSKKMIDRCKSNDSEVIEWQIKRHGTKDTSIYEPLVNQIMNYSEEDFQKFIVTNYVCGKKGVNIIRTFSGNMIASVIYKALVKRLQELTMLAFDHAKVSHDRLYSIIEAKYYLKNRCFRCGLAEQEELFKRCPYFKERCEEEYEKFLTEISASHNEGEKPKSFMERCAKCDAAWEERLFEKCSAFEDKCKGLYAEYRAKKLSPAEERQEIIKERNAIIKAEVIEIFKNAGDLFSELEITVGDEKFKNLLDAIEKKFEVQQGKSTIEECINATFMPTENVEDYVTRTKMIVLYYYVFVFQNLCDGVEYDNFIDFYNDFCEEFVFITNNYFKNGSFECYGINDALIVSGYQEINSGNFFDIILVFLTYRNYRNFYEKTK